MSDGSEIYLNSPVLRSPRKLKPTNHLYPSSSSGGQASSVFRHKSPATRHFSPHRSISRNKISHNHWEADVSSIRKTQSTALPAFKSGGLWQRGGTTTASTPDLIKVDDEQSIIVGSREPRTPQPAIVNNTTLTKSYYYNLRVILNIIILIAGLIHLTSGVLLIAYKEIVLIIVENLLYVLCLILLYTEAAVLLFLPIIEFINFRHHQHGRSQKRHVGCCLLIVTLTILVAILQSTVETNIQKNLRQQMISSMKLESEANGIKAIWDYFQFNCCGVNAQRGHFDWCTKIDDLTHDAINSTDFLGSYTCRLPASCCIDYKTMYTEKSLNLLAGDLDTTSAILPCLISPTPWNTHRIGCLEYVRREIYYTGKMFRIMNFGTLIVLFVSSMIASLLFVYPAGHV